MRRRRSLPLLLPLLVPLAGCAAVPRPNEAYIFHGPEPVLDAFVAAAADCRYPGVEKSLGSHVEPVVVLTLPRPPTPQYRCTMQGRRTMRARG